MEMQKIDITEQEIISLKQKAKEISECIPPASNYEYAISFGKFGLYASSDQVWVHFRHCFCLQLYPKYIVNDRKWSEVFVLTGAEVQFELNKMIKKIENHLYSVVKDLRKNLNETNECLERLKKIDNPEVEFDQTRFDRIVDWNF